MSFISEIRLQKCIIQADVGTSIDISSLSHYYRRVKFTLEYDGTYFWIADMKGLAVSAMPLISRNRVKTFKTLAGAKRNFLKRAIRAEYDGQ